VDAAVALALADSPNAAALAAALDAGGVTYTMPTRGALPDGDLAGSTVVRRSVGSFTELLDWLHATAAVSGLQDPPQPLPPRYAPLQTLAAVLAVIEEKLVLYTQHDEQRRQHGSDHCLRGVGRDRREGVFRLGQCEKTKPVKTTGVVYLIHWCGLGMV
jgi:hypothetical protein